MVCKHLFLALLQSVWMILRPYRSLSCFVLPRPGHLVSAVSIPGRSRPTARRSALPKTAKRFANTSHSQEADLALGFFPPPVAAVVAVCVCQFPRLPSLIRGKCSKPCKLRKALCKSAFRDQTVRNHPHDL